MSDPVGRWLVLEVLFIILGVFCSLAMSAVRECSESKLIKAAESGDKRAAALLPTVQEPDDFCAAMRVGAVVFGFFAVMNPLTALMVKLVEVRVSSNFDVQQLVGGITWVVLLLLSVVVIDIIPDRYSWHRADKAARALYPAARLLAFILKPLSWLLVQLAQLFLRLVGIHPDDEIEEVSEDEILLMVGEGEESGAIGQEEKELIENIFQFNDLTAEDVMVHRTDMEFVSLDEGHDAILALIRESGFSRFPVCGEDVDDVKGVLNSRQYLLNQSEEQPLSLEQLLRPAFFVPESVRADALFREMQQKKVHMAIVVDEYGGTAGVVTMEDLLEELVGEIYDEFDEEEEQEITSLPDGSWRIAGAASLEDISEELELALPEEEMEEYETLAGLILGRLAIIPEDGTTPRVYALGMEIQVEKIAEHRVEWANVRLVDRPDPED